MGNARSIRWTDTVKRESLGLCWSDEGPSGYALKILDQRRLPDEEVWIQVRSSEHMAELIRTLAVRGAPLIGVAAALAVGLECASGSRGQRLLESIAGLRAARPTAVNLMWALDRVLREGGALDQDSVTKTAVAIFDEDVAMCEAMGRNGASRISDGEGCLTICNTGGLATVGKGTAFAALRTAHEQGKKIHIYACETRPLLQGGRLTAWELRRLGIPFTLLTDSMAAVLMRENRVQSVWTGCDRMTRRGDFANKIGTYSLAVLAKHHQKRFYPVLPASTIDLASASGGDIEIEQRGADEVLGFSSPARGFRWAPEGAATFNPAFDMTPAELVTEIVLDQDVFSVPQYRAYVETQMKVGL